MKNLARWEPVAEGVMQKVIEPVNDDGYVKFSDIKDILKPSNNKQRLEIVNLDRWDGKPGALIYWVNQCVDKVNEIVHNINRL